MVKLLDSTGTGAIQLDRRGRIVAANDAARTLLREDGGLSDEDGVLRALLPVENAELQRLLARALASRGAAGSMRLSRAGYRPPLVLHITPVHEADGEATQAHIRAVVLAFDPAWRWNIDPEQVADLLGLTRAESRIAALLAQGRSIDEVVAETGRSRTTVKWHIRHIYDKNGLSRQTELMQLVSSLGSLGNVPAATD